MIGVIRGDARSLDYCSCRVVLGIHPDSPVVSRRGVITENIIGERIAGLLLLGYDFRVWGVMDMGCIAFAPRGLCLELQ